MGHKGEGGGGTGREWGLRGSRSPGGDLRGLVKNDSSEPYNNIIVEWRVNTYTNICWMPIQWKKSRRGTVQPGSMTM